MEIPVLSVDLIKALDKAYPLKNPSPDLPEKTIRYRAGQRSVVEMLLSSIETHIEDQMKK